jgi:hypothetical protein
MGVSLQKRLNILISDVQMMQKELFLSRISRPRRSRSTLASWEALREKVSVAWDTVSAVDEIASQREKQW